MKKRAASAAWQRFYASTTWRALRRAHLAAHPLCEWCREDGRTTAAAVVDHVKAHRGDRALFLDPANLLSLCKPHHDSCAQARDKSGHIRGCSVDGKPRDPSHPWNVARRVSA